MMAIQRPRRVVPPPAGAGALEIRVCNDPNKACGPKGGNAVIALMEEACNAGEDTERAYVQRTGCVDKCAFGVACVAGWEDEHGEFQRAGVQRPADDPLMDPRHALALSGVWSKVETLEDCEAIVAALEAKAAEALALSGVWSKVEAL